MSQNVLSVDCATLIKHQIISINQKNKRYFVMLTHALYEKCPAGGALSHQIQFRNRGESAASPLHSRNPAEAAATAVFFS